MKNLNLSFYLKSFCFLIFAFSGYPETGLAQVGDSPYITKLSLVRADNGQVLIDSLSDNHSINLKSLPTNKINLIAHTNTKNIRKVEFVTSGSSTFSDFVAPFAYKGDDGGNLYSWIPNEQIYQIRITPYDKETQVAGKSKTYFLNFSSTIQSPTPAASVLATQTPAATPQTSPSQTAAPSPSPKASVSPTQAPFLSQTPAPSITSSPTQTPNPSPSQVASPKASDDSLKVFPGAEGFGTESVAGSGRNLNPPKSSIYFVSNLNSGGSGSLRACAEAFGPRVCIFNISGKLILDEAITITNPYLTIAGQTAPSPGFTLVGAGLKIRTHDVLVKHLRIRIGDEENGPTPKERDGVVVWGEQGRPAYNVVIDHTSVSWAVDENVSTYGDFVNNVTISNSIIAEGLFDSIHPKGRHSMGVLIGEGSQRITLHHNLLAHNHDRNPRLNPGSSVEVVGNLVYNWGGTSGWNVANISDTKNLGTATLLNFVGNVYKMGPDSSKVPSITGKPANSSSKIYVLDNFGPTRPNASFPEWAITDLSESRNRSYEPALPFSNVFLSDAEDVVAQVSKTAGARPNEFNPVDERIRNEVRQGTGRIKDCIKGCKYNVGTLDSSESSYRNLYLPENPHDDDNNDGYTNLEEWLHSYSLNLE